MPTRLEVDQAIKCAINTEDDVEREEALKIIIAYAQDLPVIGDSIEITSIKCPDPDKKITGCTDELGEVTVHNPDKRPGVWTHGPDKDRVGHYRMWRTERGELFFHHFWASDVDTASETREPIKYHLFFDYLRLEPTSFGYYEVSWSGSIHAFSYRLKLELLAYHPLWGSKKSDACLSFNLREIL